MHPPPLKILRFFSKIRFYFSPTYIEGALDRSGGPAVPDAF